MGTAKTPRTPRRYGVKRNNLPAALMVSLVGELSIECNPRQWSDLPLIVVQARACRVEPRRPHHKLGHHAIRVPFANSLNDRRPSQIVLRYSSSSRFSSSVSTSGKRWPAALLPSCVESK